MLISLNNIEYSACSAYTIADCHADSFKTICFYCLLPYLLSNNCSTTFKLFDVFYWKYKQVLWKTPTKRKLSNYNTFRAMK